MKNVNVVSRISGVSVRTLHYYDSIGLLTPSKRTEAGYRLYDDEAIKRLKTILIYRELEFPLNKIKKILDSKSENKPEIIKEQIRLLKLRKKHFEDLINLANKMLKDDNFMDFSAFDKEKLKEYDKEAKEKWGDTKEYAEYESKKGGDNSAALMEKFSQIGKLKNSPIESDEVKKAITEIKDFITDNYYTCGDEMFVNLGLMYVSDERFKNNIDSAGGNGTAEFVSKAIMYHFKH